MNLIAKLKKIMSCSHKNDVVEFKESLYSCTINGESSWHESKEKMMSFIAGYAKFNTIYSLSMFRMDMYNLID